MLVTGWRMAKEIGGSKKIFGKVQKIGGGGEVGAAIIFLGSKIF